MAWGGWGGVGGVGIAGIGPAKVKDPLAFKEIPFTLDRMPWGPFYPFIHNSRRVPHVTIDICCPEALILWALTMLLTVILTCKRRHCMVNPNLCHSSTADGNKRYVKKKVGGQTFGFLYSCHLFYSSIMHYQY